MIRNYLCERCSQLLPSDRQPSSFGCPAGPSHRWRDLGPRGSENYLCDRCGTLVATDKQPTSFGCPGGPSHLWRHQGSRAERLRPFGSSSGGGGGSPAPVSVSGGSGAKLPAGCTAIAVGLGMVFAIGDAIWQRITKPAESSSSQAAATPALVPSEEAGRDYAKPAPRQSMAPQTVDSAESDPVPVARALPVEAPENQPPPVAPAVPVLELSPAAVITNVLDNDLRMMAKRFQNDYAGRLVRFTESVVRKNAREQLLVFKGGGFLATAYDVQVRLDEDGKPGFDDVAIGDRLTILGTLDRLVPAPFGLGGSSIRIHGAQIVKQTAAPPAKRRK